MKCLLKLAVIGLLLIALLVGGVFLFIDTVVETAVTKGVTFTTQQETTLGSADVQLLSGKLGFEDLEIANPPGFQEGPMLRIAGFQTAIDRNGTQEDVVHLTELKLDGLELALELNGKQHNLEPLLARLKELKGADPTDPGAGEPEPTEPTEPSGPTTQEEPGPELRIGRIEITNLKSSLRITGVPLADGVYQLDVPDILIEDFDDDMQSATVVEWSAYLLETLLSASLAAGDDVFPQEWQKLFAGGLLESGLLDGDLEQVQEYIEGLSKEELDALELQGKEELKKLEDEYKKELREDPEGAVDKAKDDLKDAEKKLKGLFGKD